MKIRRAVLTLLLIICGFQIAHAKRLALVIGNGAYAQASPLLNPARDARAIADKLRTLGFTVTHKIDRTKGEMEKIIQRFVRDAGGAEIALFFYSGHGIQVRGENYIIPTDARLKDISDVKFELLNATKLVREIEKKAKTTLVFLDACRDNPFVQNMRGYTRNVGTRGLADAGTPSRGTLIAFAAQPGALAEDGSGDNSPFTTALLDNLGRPGDSISQTLTRVRRSVHETTRGGQIPQDFNSLLEEVYLADKLSSDDQTSDLQRRLAAVRKRIERLKKGLPADAGRSTTSFDVAYLPVRRPPMPKPKHKPGMRFKDCKFCPEMVVIPPGTFKIGSPENEDMRSPTEGPRKVIKIPKAFALGRFEVTRGEYRRFANEVGRPALRCWVWDYKRNTGISSPKHNWKRPGYKQTDKHPVACVSWLDAKAYLRWLSEKTGEKYRFPTEAEWEYAARAGTTTMFYFGNRISTRQVNFSSWHKRKFSGARAENFWRKGTMPVKTLPPNNFGLYHMLGNLKEHVQDCYEPNYEFLPPDGQAYDREGCSKRSARGGSWLDWAWDSRSARRSSEGDTWHNTHVGIRVARDLAE